MFSFAQLVDLREGEGVPRVIGFAESKEAVANHNRNHSLGYTDNCCHPHANNYGFGGRDGNSVSTLA